MVPQLSIRCVLSLQVHEFGVQMGGTHTPPEQTFPTGQSELFTQLPPLVTVSVAGQVLVVGETAGPPPTH